MALVFLSEYLQLLPPALVKDFLRYYIALSTGKVEEEKNHVTVDHFYTRFCNALEAATAQTLVRDDREETLRGKAFPEEEKAEIPNVSLVMSSALVLA